MPALDGDTLKVVCGDSINVQILIMTKHGNLFVPQEGDIITFSVQEKFRKRNPYKNEWIIDPKTLKIVIPSSETSKFPPGEYRYDVKFERDDWAETFIANKTMIVDAEI